MPKLRELGPMEAEFAEQARLGQANFCAVFFWEGPWPQINLGDLIGRMDLAILRVSLQGREVRDEGRVTWSQGRRASKDDWRSLAERAILEKMDASVAQFQVLVGDDSSEVLITLSHAVFDGLSGIELGKMFFRALDGHPVSQAIPAPMSAHVPAFDQDAHNVFLQQQKATAPDEASVERYSRLDRVTRRTESLSLEFDESETTGLIQSAKSKGLRLFPLIAAAIMQSASKTFCEGLEVHGHPASNGRPIPNADSISGLTIPVNLRARLSPAVPHDALGVYMGFLLSWHDVRLPLIDLAKDIQSRMDQGLESHEAFHRQEVLRHKSLALPRATISISNIGVIENIPRVSSIRSLVALWSSDPAAIVMQSYQNRLLIEFLTSPEKLGPGAGKSWARATRESLTEPL